MTDSEKQLSVWEEVELDSGVTVQVGPFPGTLYWDIVARGLSDWPDPETPQREIETFDGPEWVDDEDDPDYQAELKEVRSNRNSLLGEAALEFCVRVDLEEWEPTIKRLEDKYVAEPAPKDLVERTVWFLSKYAARSRSDWSKLIGIPVRKTLIGEEDVAQRADSFRSDMEGPEGDRADARGAAEAERVEV